VERRPRVRRTARLERAPRLRRSNTAGHPRLLLITRTRVLLPAPIADGGEEVLNAYGG